LEGGCFFFFCFFFFFWACFVRFYFFFCFFFSFIFFFFFFGILVFFFVFFFFFFLLFFFFYFFFIFFFFGVGVGATRAPALSAEPGCPAPGQARNRRMRAGRRGGQGRKGRARANSGPPAALEAARGGGGTWMRAWNRGLRAHEPRVGSIRIAVRIGKSLGGGVGGRSEPEAINFLDAGHEPPDRRSVCNRRSPPTPDVGSTAPFTHGRGFTPWRHEAQTDCASL